MRQSHRAHGFVSAFSLLLSLLLALPAAADTPNIGFDVVARYPHRSEAFTEGLELVDGLLYESSGLDRKSFIIAGPLTGEGRVIRQRLPEVYFGEGLTVFGDSIYLLTWRNQRGFIFDKKTLRKTGEFSYAGEGWGLTHNDKQLIMSDGSANLKFLEPGSGRVVKTVPVTENGRPVIYLNELERVGKRVLANVWQTDNIVVIDPDTGVVTARIDLGKLYPPGMRKPGTDVLNGIALDPADNTLLVTGKWWPTLYRLRLRQALP